MRHQKRPVIDRLMAKVDTTSQDCWVWQGALCMGYGVIGLGSRDEGIDYVHRIAYEHFVGPIPEGLHIDHLCRNRPCCNPTHLEAVTQAENNRRMREAQSEQKKRTAA